MNIIVSTLFEPGDRIKYYVVYGERNEQGIIQRVQETKVGVIRNIKVEHIQKNNTNVIYYEIIHNSGTGLNLVDWISEEQIISSVSTNMLKGFSTEDLKKELESRGIL